MEIETLIGGKWHPVSEEQMLAALTVDAVPPIADRIVAAVESKATRRAWKEVAS